MEKSMVGKAVIHIGEVFVMQFNNFSNKNLNIQNFSQFARQIHFWSLGGAIKHYALPAPVNQPRLSFLPVKKYIIVQKSVENYTFFAPNNAT